MKNVFKNFNIFVFMLGMLSMVTFMTSCEEDKCEGVTCQNDGVCIDGTCDCPDWYTGTNCETATRTKFLGDYTGTETCSLGSTVTYNVTAATNADGAGFMTFQNMYNVGFNGKAQLTGETTFDFVSESQSINGSTWTLVSGSGSIDGTTITITYTMELNGGQDACTLTLTK